MKCKELPKLVVSEHLHHLPEVHLMITKAHVAALKCEGIDWIQHCSLLFPQYCAPGCNAIVTAGLNFKLDIILTKDKAYHAEKTIKLNLVCVHFTNKHTANHFFCFSVFANMQSADKNPGWNQRREKWGKTLWYIKPYPLVFCFRLPTAIICSGQDDNLQRRMAMIYHKPDGKLSWIRRRTCGGFLPAPSNLDQFNLCLLIQSIYMPSPVRAETLRFSKSVARKQQSGYPVYRSCLKVVMWCPSPSIPKE